MVTNAHLEWARRASVVVLLAGTAGCPSCEPEELQQERFELCLRPTDLAFGDQPVRTSRSQTLAIQNCGNVDITSVNVTLEPADPLDDGSELAAFQILETSVTLPLAKGGGSFFLPVRFRPRMAGQFAGRLVFSMTSASGQTSSAEKSVSGTGVEPGQCSMVVEPDLTPFGTVPVGTAEQSDVTLRNVGTGRCEVAGFRFTAGAEHFSVATPAPQVLEANATGTLTLRYAPRSEGNHVGTLAFVANGSVEVTAEATGTGERVRTCALAASPTAVAFPRSVVGSAPPAVDVTVTNVGEAACQVSGAMLSGAAGLDFSLGGAVLMAPVMLMPMEATVVTVSFMPGTLGFRQAELSVASVEAPDVVVPVSAFADPAPTCVVRASPNPLLFDELGVGLTREADVTVENISAEPCTIGDTALTPDSTGDFTLVTAPQQGVLMPGQSTSMRVRFTPQAASLAQGAAEIELGGGAMETVELVGLGAFADLRLTPGLQYFGIVTTGCTSPEETVTLSNVGMVPARVDTLAFTAASDPNFELLTPIMPGRLIQPGENIPMRIRMLGAPNPGSHHGQLQVTATGAIQPALRTTAQGTTQSVQDAQRVEVFTQRQVPALDILFVIDDSGSMSEEQTNLRNNINSFISNFSTQNVDYHLGVVTTDTASAATAGALRLGKYITNSGPNPTPNPVTEFNALAMVGTSGSATEKGLEASLAAVTSPRINDVNQGFLREEALLSVVYISDEDDYSTGSVASYVDALIAAKGNRANAVLLNAIAGPVPQGCNGAGGNAARGTRYFDAVNAVGGVFGSICSTNWALLLEQIGQATYAALTRFALTRPPDASTITVVVDGMIIPNDPVNGWFYDEANNSIVFRGTAIPESGDQISVSYETECIAP